MADKLLNAARQVLKFLPFFFFSITLIAALITIFTEKKVWFLLIISLVIAIILFATRKFFSRDQIADMHLKTNTVNPIKVHKNTFLRIIKIKVGEYQDFLWEDLLIRIKLLDIKRDLFIDPLSSEKSEEYGAILDINIGGGVVVGGEITRELDVNKYIVPEKKFEYEEKYSIFSFNADQKDYYFFRLFVEHINIPSNLVELNLFFASSNKINTG